LAKDAFAFFVGIEIGMKDEIFAGRGEHGARLGSMDQIFLTKDSAGIAAAAHVDADGGVAVTGK
jgi:hypothetical protein